MKYFNEIFFGDFVGLSNFECPNGGRGGGGGKGGEVSLLLDLNKFNLLQTENMSFLMLYFKLQA